MLLNIKKAFKTLAETSHEVNVMLKVSTPLIELMYLMVMPQTFS